ncbi:chemotaxis protein CheC [Serpentinicella alkaliphila]|uniref:Chemotaxis protein CheC n=1 Tax=Serpentinicella alkaliphila TaxID=1734049 RepID=A0A4R2UDR3_9FIRM|nr:chemotaxis protein CheC [Serpentinicella alkaliphila]QUH26303.1 chemotaxis protein CheC [Serpentinicella alkaliphila]TCQ05883.1 chemotaxis protein CheC [Serpentinicella alkaliphila]
MAFSVNDLNNLHLDVLREIGNIGAGNAATALATLINKKVDMNVPKIQILDYNDISQILGGEEAVVAGIYFGVDGDIEGNIMFLLDYGSSKKLTGMLMGKDDNREELDDMDRSALQEIGNILSGSYISSLSALTGLFLNLSVPSLCIDMAGAILSVPAIQFGYVSDKVLLIETELMEGNDLVKANFFLIPDINSFDILLNSLGVYN